MKSITIAEHKGKRSYQEDRHFVSKLSSGLAFGIFDGHGGSQTSDYAARNAEKLFSETFGNSPEDILRNIVQALNLATENNYDGSTLSLGFIPNSEDTVYIAVLGDSPIVVKRPDSTLWVSPDHNIRSNPEEAQRAVQRGGFIQGGYLFDSLHGNGLQMSRALGDRELGRVLSREPEVFTLPLGDWVFAGSDGALDPSHFVNPIPKLADMIETGAEAEDIVKYAVNLPTHDNVTAIVIRR